MNRQVTLWSLFLVLVFILGSCDVSSGTEGENEASHLTYLGKGYDAFDSYADSTAIKSTILDAEAMYAAGLLELTLEENSKTYDVSGESVDEYLSSYDICAGVSTDFGLFSGTLTAKFGSAEFSSTTKAYATYSSSVRKFKEKVSNEYNNADDLRPYVRDSVLARLDSCESVEDAEDFFAVYGTHVIVWDYQGARVDYHATTTSSDYSSASDFSADVTASYKGLSTDDSYSSSSEYSSFESKVETELQIYGGPSQYANSILSGDFSLWEEGVGDSSTWTLCDFGQDDNIDSLMPVWALCSGDDDGIDEAALFESAFDDWADDNEINITEAEPASYDITFKLDHVVVYIDDNEDGAAEFRGKLKIDGSRLWYVSSSDDGYSLWDSTEDTATTTDVSGYSSDRYTSVTKTYTVYDDDGDRVYVDLDISNLEEIDTFNQDEYSDESKSYSIYYIVNTLSDSGHLWIKSEDGNEYVKFYIDVELSANY